MNDDQLDKILAESRPPVPSAALDERMMNSYRRITRNRIWFVLLHARIPVPVPVAAAFVAVFLGAVLWKVPQPLIHRSRAVNSGPIQAGREVATLSRRSQPQTHSPTQRDAAPIARQHAESSVAWIPVSRPEWRIVR